LRHPILDIRRTRVFSRGLSASDVNALLPNTMIGDFDLSDFRHAPPLIMPIASQIVKNKTGTFGT
jgi:hypothetical protein